MNYDLPAQFLCFDIGEKSYAISLLNVLEIIKPAETIPGKTVSYHREQLSLFYPAKQLLEEKNADPSQRRVLIIEIQGRRVGLLVDFVREIMRINRNQVRPPASESGVLGIGWVDNVIITDERIIHLVAPEKLICLIPVI